MLFKIQKQTTLYKDKFIQFFLNINKLDNLLRDDGYHFDFTYNFNYKYNEKIRGNNASYHYSIFQDFPLLKLQKVY